MWPFSRKFTKAALECHKHLRINGWNFVIKKINPVIDFKDGYMPQIFTAFISKRTHKIEDIPKQSVDKIEEDIKKVIEAGLVVPKLAPRNSKDEITVNDLFRDEDTCMKLYWEIFMHSLNKFKGLKGFFTSIKIRYNLFMLLRKNTDDSLHKLSLVSKKFP